MSGLDKYIEIQKGVRGGKPCIAGTRITVADVAKMYLRMGQSLEEIAGKYNLSLVSVYASIAFYYENRDEIDRRTADSEAFIASERLKTTSLLNQKLEAMRNYA